MYKHEHQRDISAHSVAQMLSNTLYYRRFFPIYTFNVVAGVHDGKGMVMYACMDRTGPDRGPLPLRCS